MSHYVFNPFTNKLDIAEDIVLPPGTLGFLEGDTGGSVGPDGGGVIYLSAGNGMKVAGNAGTNTLNISNIQGASKYVVDGQGQAEYTTIQAAINQAIADGADATTPAVIYIWAGTYTENLSLAPYVHLAADAYGSVNIVGNAVLSNSSAFGLFIANYVNFVSNNTQAAILFQGSAITNVILQNILITASVANSIGLENNGSSFIIGLVTSSINADISSKCLEVNAGIVIIDSCSITSSDTPSTIDASTVFVYNSYIIDSYSITNSGTIAISGSYFQAVQNNPCIDIDGSSDASVQLSNLISNEGNNHYVTGSGTLIQGANVISGNAQAVDPALTLNGLLTTTGNLSFDGGATTISADGQLIIGKTGDVPQIATLTAGNGIDIINGAGSITIEKTPPAASQSSSLILGTAYQNTFGYDVMLTVYISISNATNGNILLGVGPTNTPTQQTIIANYNSIPSSVHATVSVPIYLAKNYYALLSSSGTITVSIQGQIAIPV